jgi:hypothetical protein
VDRGRRVVDVGDRPGRRNRLQVLVVKLFVRRWLVKAFLRQI